MANKPCLDCGTPTPHTRCPRCGPARPTRQQRGLDRTHYRITHTVITQWVSQHGWTCPGYERDPHHVEPGTLTGDHIIARTIRPDLTHDPDNYTVLCRPCNSRKGNR